MKNLVQRYIMSRQNKICERGNVTEDDINEIKQELLKFKNDLIHILQESGMKTKPLNECKFIVISNKIIFVAPVNSIL